MARKRSSGISPVQGEYLDMLRSALWGTEPDCMPTDVVGVLKIADLQKTRPLILNAMQRAGLIDNNPQYMDIIYRTASTHMTLNHAIAQLIPMFRKHGIDPILLKGQGVAQNYPEPMLRECGDIDLYVGEENYEKACDLVKGLATEAEIEQGEEIDKHYHIHLNRVLVEIHRMSEFIKNKRQNAYYQSISKEWLNREPVQLSFAGVPVNTPADSFNAFYIFYHLWHHFEVDGLGLRQVCDWTMFLHSRAGKLDTSVIEDSFEPLKIRTAWQIFASIAVDYLGLPASEMPFYKANMDKKAAAILSLILNEGNFGHGRSQKRPNKFLSGKFFSMKKFLKRDIIIFRYFPEYRPEMRSRIANYLIGGIGRLITSLFKR